MDWIKLRQEYESSEISLKDLAVKYGVSESTMRSRKNREKWQRNAIHDATQRTVQREEKKKNVATPSGKTKREPRIRVIVNNREIEKDKSLDLTEKQVLFVAEYLTDFNATRAAMAVGYSKKTAHSIGWENLRKPEIQTEIKRQTELLASDLGITSQKILLEYLKIAFADITEYTDFGQRDVPVMNMFGPVYEGKGKNKKAVLKTVNFVDLKSSSEIDGTLISEIKQSKDGVSIKLYDKTKALEVLCKRLDLLPDPHKRRIEEEKLKLDQAKFDIEKAKATGSTGIEANNERILTLAKLINNPVPNRNVEDFEEDDEPGDS